MFARIRADAMALALLASVSAAWAGPYSLGSDDPNNPFDAPIPGFVGPDGDGVVSATNTVNPVFIDWATSVADYSPSPGVGASWSNPGLALGPVFGHSFHIVSLGDLDQTAIDNGDPPGQITLQFDTPIANGPGPDFAAFENAFVLGTTSPGGGSPIDLLFAELGYVEVSSDGVNFARFDSTSLTPQPSGGQAFLTVNPTDVHNLVGKHINGSVESWGTPFDLAQLTSHASVQSGLVDLFAINHVRIVDIPGNGAFLDASDGPVYDPWVTFDSGGVDLEAVGVIHRTRPGDINFDLMVGVADLGLLSANWGTGTTWDTGDVSGDGSANVTDLAIIANRWGTIYDNTSLSEPSGATSVPAPGACMAAIGLWVLLGRRRP